MNNRKRALELLESSGNVRKLCSIVEFTDVLMGTDLSKKLNTRELVRGLRIALANEEDAIMVYDTLFDKTDNTDVQKVLKTLSDEEKVHAGELQKLLNILEPGEEDLVNKGSQEVSDVLGQ